jgi:predicted transcriptional regulator
MQTRKKITKKTSQTKSSNGKSVKQIERRWSRTVSEMGWTAIPNIILEKQQELQLGPSEFNVLIQLLKYWWDKENLPHPAKTLIAEQMGVSPRTVQRSIAKLEALGLVKRITRTKPNEGQSSNYHDFSGLIKKITPLAKQSAKERKARDSGKKYRR